MAINKNFNAKNGLSVNGTQIVDSSGNVTIPATLSSPNLSVTNSAGDEGGEILLAKAQTNTTLVGTGVTIDVYQNKVRIFEQGGTARGVYIDLTAAGAGVSTNLVSGGGGGGTVTGVTATAPVISSGGTAPVISMSAASSSANGYLTSADWTTFNNKTSNTGTVTSVAALTLGTTGTDVSSTVANGTTTPVITLNIPTASATNRGALSAADWTTFNNKQPAGTYATGTGTAAGTNTGDETSTTIKTKLGITTLSGSNTGDQTIPTTLPNANAITFAATGGAVANSSYTGAAVLTVDYSTVGAAAASHTHSYQAADADLLAIGGLTGTSGYLKKTAADTWTLDTSTFATGTGTASGTNTGDNAINTLYSGLVSNATHTGDVTGATVLTLATVNSNVGTFNNLTVNGKGLVTAASNTAYLTAEADTLATVTARGASTTTLIQLSNQAVINVTTPGTANYGLHFTGQTTADYATGITWNGGTGTTGAQAGIYVQGSGSYGSKMYIATTDSYATGSKTAIAISEMGVANFLRARPQWNGTNLVIASDVVSSITSTTPIVVSASTGAVALSHATSGVTASTYNNVTVNTFGHVTAGSNVAYLTAEADTLATVTARGASTTIASTFPDVYVGNWFRNNSSLTGIYNQANANHFYSNAGNQWAITGNGGTTVSLQYRLNHESTIKGYTYADSSGFGLLGGTGAWGVRIVGDDWVDIAGSSIRAKIFYDNENTSYYVDPNGSSYLYGLTLSGNTYFRPQTWIQFDGSYGLYWPNNNGAHLHANDLSTYTQLAIRGYKNSYGGIYDQYSAVNIGMYDSNGNGGLYREANGRWYQYYNVANDSTGFGTSTTNSAYNIYAPKGIYSGGRVDGTIFYDTNDTSYYVDPNSASYIQTLVIGKVTGSTAYGNASEGNLYFGTYGSQDYRVYTSLENFGGNYTKLILDWHTGIKLGAYYGYGGIRFYNNAINSGGAKVFSVAEGDNHVRVVNNLYAPILYDTDNTAYYIDPATNNNIKKQTATAGTTSVAASSSETFTGGGRGHNGWGANAGPSFNGYSNIIGAGMGTNSGYGNYAGGDPAGVYYGGPGNYTSGGAAAVYALGGDGGYYASGGVGIYAKGGAHGTWAVAGQENNRVRAYAGYLDGDTIVIGNLGVGTNNPQYQLHLTSTGYSATDFRAPIFYDSNDTSYYIDPSATSVLNRINTVRADNWLYLNSNYGHSVVGVYDSYKYQGVWSMGDAYKLPADGSTTGNLYGLAWSYPNAGGAAANLASHGLLLLENGSWNFAVGGGSARVTGDMRAPIFYDQNNTAYYIDPNSTSNLVGLTVANTISGSITNANNAITAANLVNFDNQSGYRWSTNFNTILSTGFYNAENVPPNAPGAYGQLIVAKGIDTGLQIYGGYNNDNLWFRGWGSSGSTFYSWRKVWHDGNLTNLNQLTNGPGYTTNTGTVTGVTATSPVASSGGTAPVISMAAASAGVNGYMTGAYATKLDGIASGATANTGTVTGVTATSPVASSGGTAPVISMAAATSTVNGYMTSTYAAKLDGIAAGATANTGTVTGVTATSPVASSGGTAPVISMAAASAGVNGYMTGVYATKLDGIASGATANTGTVTGVTATSPVASSGGTAPVISMAAATSTVNGYMTSTYAAKLDSLSTTASTKAWVSFNGSTAVIRASYNVSSVTKNTTGDYTINFTTAMSDANYATTLSGNANTNAYSVIQVSATGGQTTGSCRITSVAQSSGAPIAYDAPIIGGAFFR